MGEKSASSQSGLGTVFCRPGEAYLEAQSFVFDLVGTHHHRDRTRYVSQVAHEVKRAKNAWFQEKAQKVEVAMRGGKGVWNGLRAMQRGRAGL